MHWKITNVQFVVEMEKNLSFSSCVQIICAKILAEKLGKRLYLKKLED